MDTRDHKTYGFSYRVSARTRFAADFGATMKGQTHGAFVERSVLRHAAPIKCQKCDHVMDEDLLAGGKPWDFFWDDSEPVRWLKVYLEPKIPLEDSNEKRPEMTANYRGFVLAHRAIFYDGNTPNQTRAEVLWPQMAHWVEAWHHHKTTNPGAAEEKMIAALKRASPKLWPPK